MHLLSKLKKKNAGGGCWLVREQEFQLSFRLRTSNRGPALDHLQVKWPLSRIRIHLHPSEKPVLTPLTVKRELFLVVKCCYGILLIPEQKVTTCSMDVLPHMIYEWKIERFFSCFKTCSQFLGYFLIDLKGFLFYSGFLPSIFPLIPLLRWPALWRVSVHSCTVCYYYLHNNKLIGHVRYK